MSKTDIKHPDRIRSMQPILHKCAEDHRLVMDAIAALHSTPEMAAGDLIAYSVKVEALAKALVDLYDEQMVIKIRHDAMVRELDERKQAEAIEHLVEHVNQRGIHHN